MDLNFTKQGNLYVADFTATSDFNIHIEKEEGYIHILQSTVEGGEYDYIKGLNISHLDPVIDMDFTAAVYPKYIRVKSRVMPTKAVVTFNQA